MITIRIKRITKIIKTIRRTMSFEIKSQEILQFWFQELTPSQHFKKDSLLDQQITEKFQNSLISLKDLPENEFLISSESSLAAVILFDQFSRNIYRNLPESFSFDNKALNITKQAIELQYDLNLPNNQRAFLYMPYMHSESIDDQNKSVELFSNLSPQFAQYAIAHRDIIEKFGRFPHRNQILARDSTEEEIEFLKTEGSSF